MFTAAKKQLGNRRQGPQLGPLEVAPLNAWFRSFGWLRWSRLCGLMGAGSWKPKELVGNRKTRSGVAGYGHGLKVSGTR